VRTSREHGGTDRNLPAGSKLFGRQQLYEPAVPGYLKEMDGRYRETPGGGVKFRPASGEIEAPRLEPARFMQAEAGRLQARGGGRSGACAQRCQGAGNSLVPFGRGLEAGLDKSARRIRQTARGAS